MPGPWSLGRNFDVPIVNDPASGIAVLVPDPNSISKEAELLRKALVAADVDIELMPLGDLAVRGPLQLLITARAS